MSASPSPLKSPPPRLPPEGRVQTRSSGSAASQCALCSPPARSPCVLCSPPARESLRSLLDDHVKADHDPVGPSLVETWCSPTLVSPAGRQCSAMQLRQHQEAAPVNIGNAFLEDEQWDMEAMVLSTIAGQLEDEEEEEEEEEEKMPDLFDEIVDESDNDDDACPWAQETRGVLVVGDKSSSEGTPSGAALAVAGAAAEVKSDASRLPTSGTAQQRKDEHFKMASELGHATFACGCPIARARGSTSCLDRFCKEQFRRWHNETYGVTADGSSAKHLDPAHSIHERMWALKEPLAENGYGETRRDAYGRKWRIKNWKLDGQEVCCHI